jgi:hypothetical protein
MKSLILAALLLLASGARTVLGERAMATRRVHRTRDLLHAAWADG